MSEPSNLEALRREIQYYKRQLDELAGSNLKRDYTIINLKREISQKRLGFALLTELQQSIGAHKEISSIFEITIQAVNSSLGMDKTVVLSPSEQEQVYRPSQWLGFGAEEGERLAGLSIRFAPEVFAEEGFLLVNSSTPVSHLIEEVRRSFGLPYFICLPVLVDQAPIGILLSGRTREVMPVDPPLDRGDVDTFQAIGGLISASVQNLRLAVFKEMDRLKTEFFANISHEFRTPITLTLGPLEQILKGRYGELSAALRDALQVVQRNQERLLGLVNQILDLSKLEAGSMTLKAAPMPDANRFIEERLTPFRSILRERGLELRTAFDPQVREADLYVDREKLEKVLSNLLSNAFKFTREGRIEVSTEIQQGSFRLTVADTGVGIKQDQLPHIFDRFRQADGSDSREYSGTGIGLALVREIVRLHGGEVSVRSRFGKGSTFQVLLPLGKAHLPPASVVEFAEEDFTHWEEVQKPVAAEAGEVLGEAVDSLNREARAGLDPARPTVLYVEDNADLRGYVRRLLAGQYNVFLAADGRDGMEMARSCRPDLILLDQMMPRMSGREALLEIRADPLLCGVPVIFLTARVGTQARIESLAAGADDYITKPFVEEELLARIRNLLLVRAQERRLTELNQAKTEFFVNLAHEIKTPLTLIANHLDRYATGRPPSRDLEVIRSNIHKLSRDMVQFFDVLKLEKGVPSWFHDQIADFSELLQGQLEMFQPEAKRHELRLQAGVEPGLHVRADPGALERVVNNLLDNAIKYNRPGGSMEVALRAADGRAVLEVRDTGIGIDPCQIPRLFQPYTQLSERKSNRQGIGMGLCLTKNIVDSLGGTLRVESKPGEGSTFTVSMALEPVPLAAKTPPIVRGDVPFLASSPASAAAHLTPNVHHPGRPTVLLVEDNADLLALLAEEVGRSYNTLLARGGLQALNLLQAGNPCDLIVCDLMMDEMDGWQLLGLLQKEEVWRQVPFLIITARTSREERLAGLQRGAIDYVFKPFAVEELLARIDSLMRYQELRRLADERERFASLGVLLAGIAHELKNPLSGISGPLDNLRKLIDASSLKADPLAEKHLGYLGRSVAEIDRLIGSLNLLVARREPATELLPMEALVRTALEPYCSDNRSRIRFRWTVDPGVMVRGDAQAAGLILSNLVANAVEAIEGEGEVEVRVEREEGENRVCVLDTGRGILKEDSERIFDAFYTTKSAGKRMGLGLFLVKTLCLQMGWSVRTEARPEGGTSFILNLPAKPAEDGSVSSST